MNIEETSLKGVYVVNSQRRTDARGSFERFFCYHELEPILGGHNIVQMNRSDTALKGSIRGLHFQHAPAAEMKMIRCLSGKVFDVALDLRENSPTFLQWHAEVLTPEQGNMLVVPEGCAHGFQTLEADASLLYLHTAYYSPACEGGVSFQDPAFDIAWPLEPLGLSERDRSFTNINDQFLGLKV